MTAICLPLASQAGTINIVLSGLDVTYSGGAANGSGAIFDVIAHPGGNLSVAEADVVSTAIFQFDFVEAGPPLVSTPGDSSYGDLKIDGVGSSLALGFHSNLGSNGGDFGFDWFTGAGAAGPRVQLGIDTISEFVVTSTTLFFTGTAVVLDQDLPYLLKFTDPTVSFSYVSSAVGIPGPLPATGFMANGGAFTITGTGVIIPEPATAGLLCVGVLAAGFGIGRRRRQ